MVAGIPPHYGASRVLPSTCTPDFANNASEAHCSGTDLPTKILDALLIEPNGSSVASDIKLAIVDCHGYDGYTQEAYLRPVL